MDDETAWACGEHYPPFESDQPLCGAKSRKAPSTASIGLASFAVLTVLLQALTVEGLNNINAKKHFISVPGEDSLC
jgi:hypothetical protein